MTNNQLPPIPSYLKQVSGWGLTEAGRRGIGGSRGAHLSIAGNDFTLVEASGQESKVGGFDQKLGGRHFHAVIVAVSALQSRIFYDGAWQPNQEYYSPPACFSEDGITPSRDAAQPQNATCNLCPQAAWGSKQTATGSKAQACQDGKRIVLYVPDKGFYGFRITPGSFKTWRSYLDTLAAQGVETQYFMTRFQFLSQGVLNFVPTSFVTEAIVKAYNRPDEIKRLLKTEPPAAAQTIASFEEPIQIETTESATAPTPTTPPPPAEAAPASGNGEALAAEPKPKRHRATKVEMLARRAKLARASAPKPSPQDKLQAKQAATFGQAMPEAIEDPNFAATIAAALGDLP